MVQGSSDCCVQMDSICTLCDQTVLSKCQKQHSVSSQIFSRFAALLTNQLTWKLFILKQQDLQLIISSLPRRTTVLQWKKNYELLKENCVRKLLRMYRSSKKLQIITSMSHIRRRLQNACKVSSVYSIDQGNLNFFFFYLRLINITCFSLVICIHIFLKTNFFFAGNFFFLCSNTFQL